VTQDRQGKRDDAEDYLDHWLSVVPVPPSDVSPLALALPLPLAYGSKATPHRNARDGVVTER